ncbi:sulfotransferase 6B1-like [Clarias gariepinus]|uniref:sulfotransferase 6B1-like n=1 Tax=Clarias gariepinus TaxID=13013 RepID=UPI00234C409C|nr:sulfotransferase 6B1-like [Clarias gariepinus]
MPSRRLLVTHLHPDEIPVSFKTNKTKMLVVFRNPKDTVVSYYHFMNKHPVLPKVESWDKFLFDFMSGEVAYGSYFDHALAWEKHNGDPNVMFVTYEELKEMDEVLYWVMAQSTQMDEEFKKKLSGTRLGAKLKYEQYCQ